MRRRLGARLGGLDGGGDVINVARDREEASGGRARRETDRGNQKQDRWSAAGSVRESVGVRATGKSLRAHPLEDVGQRAALPAIATNRCGPMGLPGPLQEACGSSRHRTLHNINHTAQSKQASKQACLDTCVFRLTRKVWRFAFVLYLLTYLHVLVPSKVCLVERLAPIRDLSGAG